MTGESDFKTPVRRWLMVVIPSNADKEPPSFRCHAKYRSLQRNYRNSVSWCCRSGRGHDVLLSAAKREDFSEFRPQQSSQSIRRTNYGSEHTDYRSKQAGGFAEFSDLPAPNPQYPAWRKQCT